MLKVSHYFIVLFHVLLSLVALFYFIIEFIYIILFFFCEKL